MGKIYKIEFRVKCKDYSVRADDEEDAYSLIKAAMNHGCRNKHRVDVRINGKTWAFLYDQDGVRKFLASKTEMEKA